MTDRLVNACSRQGIRKHQVLIQSSGYAALVARSREGKGDFNNKTPYLALFFWQNKNLPY
jgi:hypothetical protein